MVPHRTGVLESMTDGLQGKKVFAQNCLVLTSSLSNTCQNCLRVQSADKKCRKRKANNEILSPYCNKRFLTKEEVEYQLKREQMAKRNAEKREGERNLKMRPYLLMRRINRICFKWPVQ